MKFARLDLAAAWPNYRSWYPDFGGWGEGRGGGGAILWGPKGGGGGKETGASVAGGVEEAMAAPGETPITQNNAKYRRITPYFVPNSTSNA